MNAGSLIAAILGFLCSLTCVFPWFILMFMVFRWSMLKTLDGFQSRLKAWAAEGGYTIVRQERPAEAPLWNRILIEGPLYWVISPRASQWVFETQWKTFGMRAPTYSTRVVMEDRQGHRRQGRMQYIGSPIMGFRGQVESRWEEEESAPAPSEPSPPDPRDDPLWDHWIDSSRAG
jgi:hypothetical protein